MNSNSIPFFNGYNTMSGIMPMDMSFLNTPWKTGGYNATTTNSSSQSGDSVYEAWKKKTQTEQDKKIVDTNFLKEKNEEIAKTRELIDLQTKNINEIKKQKNGDGNTIVENQVLEEPQFDKDGKLVKKDKSEKGFCAKAGNWLGSAGAALLGIGKSLIGYDKNGKWKPVNALKNIAITAAAVGACFIPVVGPAIGYGLLAYGVASSGYGVYKGVKKLNRATTEEEKEIARQEVCSGAFVGAMSVAGLRGVGKGIQATNTSASTAANTANAVTKTVSNFAKDITVNAVKATGQAIKADKTLIATKGGGLQGFGKAWNDKITSAWQSFASWQKRYDTQYTQMENSLNNQISELNAQISAEINAVKRTLLEEQKAMLESNLAELRTMSTPKTKTEVDNLKTTNSATKNQEKLSSYTETSRGYEINGQSVSKQRFNAFKNNMETIQKQYNKNLNNLIKTKENIMRQYAQNPNKHQSELNTYTESSVRTKYNTPEKQKAGMESLTSKISDYETKIADLEGKITRATSPRKLNSLRGQLDAAKRAKATAESELSICSKIKFKSKWHPSTWRKNEYQMVTGRKNPSKFLEGIGKGMQQPSIMPLICLSQWNRQFEAPLFFGDLTELTPEQTEEYLSQLEKEKAELEKSLDMLKEINDVSQWNQLKALHQKQIEEAAKATEVESQENKGKN